MLAASSPAPPSKRRRGSWACFSTSRTRMRRHANDADVQSPACEALAYITLNNAANASEGVAAGLAAVHSAGHGSAAYSPTSSGSRPLNRAGQVVQQTVVLRDHQTCASNNASNQAEAGRVGLLKSLQSRLRMDHSGCPTIGGCQSLYFLLGNMDNKRRGGPASAILADLQKVMRQHTGHADMPENRVHVHYAPWLTTANARAQAARLGLLEDVGVALSKHANDGVSRAESL
eukprot:jgi/Tetstr1/423249/TSEL_013949.t1